MELPHKAFCLALDLKVCDQQSFAFVWDFASSILLSLATSLWRVKAEWRAVLFAQRFSIALYWCYGLECSTRDKLWYLITLIVNWLTTLSIIFVDYIARGSMQWLLSKEGWKLQRSWRSDTHCFREHCATRLSYCCYITHKPQLGWLLCNVINLWLCCSRVIYNVCAKASMFNRKFVGCILIFRIIGLLRNPLVCRLSYRCDCFVIQGLFSSSLLSYI